MGKHISNKGNKAREGKVFARQTVRLGWRKKKFNAIVAMAKRARWKLENDGILTRQEKMLVSGGE